MSNLTSTQPGAFDALLSLLTTAGAGQSPAIAVMDSEILQYEPSQGYVLMEALEDQEFDWASLGTGAQYELYDICGRTQYAAGIVGNADFKSIRDQVFAIHQAVVQATVVANMGLQAFGGGPVLGASAPPQLEWIIPVFQRYTLLDTTTALKVGDIEWRFRVQARITVA